MIETVVFDVDDTLYDQKQPFINAFKIGFPNVSNVPIEMLFISSRKHSDAMFHKSEEGSISLRELHTHRIKASCKEFGLNISDEEAIHFQEIYIQEQQKIVLFPEIKELLNILTKRNMQLAILTNGPYEHQLMKISQLGMSKWISKENFFISEKIGVSKPNKNAFLYVEKKLHLTKNKTVYIGDSFENDIIGATQAGWNAIWLNHHKKPIPNTDLEYNMVHHPKDLLIDESLNNYMYI